MTNTLSGLPYYMSNRTRIYKPFKNNLLKSSNEDFVPDLFIQHWLRTISSKISEAGFYVIVDAYNFGGEQWTSSGRHPMDFIPCIPYRANWFSIILRVSSYLIFHIILYFQMSLILLLL